MDFIKLQQMLMRHEGLKLKPYHDTEGVLTIGIGHNLERGLTKTQVLMIFNDDIDDVIEGLENFDFYKKLDETRQMIIVDMAFNMGIASLLKFEKMITALKKGDYETAADEGLDSKWARQVKGRATFLMGAMRTGVVL